MRISAKGEYAIKAMVDLALHDGQDLQPIQDIAARQAIPQRYLEQVLLQLKRSGFLYARRGSAGGYRLSRPAEEITVGALLRAVDGPPAGPDARRGNRGEDAAGLHELWQEIAEAVASVVDRTTLDDLRRRALDRRRATRPMYHI
ncbi:MAG TPA: Rrf2 family transcriptional regulator [Candidatus Deferrimicrobiaceae bacterium]|nr:Rrf2 family transcriptional regulator [Candidatus Deferrimicrobiaceae bacterium]